MITLEEANTRIAELEAQLSSLKLKGRVIDTHTLVINKSILGKPLDTLGGLDIVEYANANNRTKYEVGELLVFSSTMADLDNFIRDLKIELQGLGYTLGGTDFANVDTNAFWILDYTYMGEFKKLNPNFNIEPSEEL